MSRIVIITRAFPFLPGEAFIEPEAPFWERDDADVIVMPWKTEGEPRPVPESVRVDDCIARIGRRRRQRARLAALGTGLFWREIGWLAKHRRLTRATAQEALRAVGGALAHRDALSEWIQQNGPIDVVYTYWWDVWTYGAQLLKGRGIGHVVTRAHGYDLYEPRHPSGYLGLKRQLGPQLDVQFAISEDGRRAAIEQYGLPASMVQLAPLGVRVPEETSRTSGAGELRVLSTALMNPVKRIDRLVDGLGMLCREHPELQVHWTHFGGGALYDEMVQRVEGLGSPANLTVDLPGNVTNDVITRHLAQQPVDVFVNTSLSEGVPVSIMEAMAHGVPTLAPAVGGIGDIVPAEGPGGELLSSQPEAAEVAEALWRWHERAKQPEQRQAAREVVDRSYDQAKNFTRLMDQLVQMA